jgi:hypothetical protein
MTIAISQPGIILVKLVIAFTDQIPFIFLWSLIIETE